LSPSPDEFLPQTKTIATLAGWGNAKKGPGEKTARGRGVLKITFQIKPNSKTVIKRQK